MPISIYLNYRALIIRAAVEADYRHNAVSSVQQLCSEYDPPAQVREDHLGYSLYAGREGVP
jgi:hypothetical protein